MHGLSNMNSQSQRPVWLWHCSIPNLPVAETNTEFQIRHHSLGWSASYRVTGWLHWTAFITEEAVFHSYRNRCLLWIWIGIFNMSCFFQNHPPRVYRMTYAAKEVCQMAHAPWTHLSYHVPQHPEVPGLAEWWNGLVQTQLQCLLLWQYIAEIEQDSPEGYTCLEWATNVWYCFSSCQHSQVHESRGRTGIIIILYYPFKPNSKISVSWSHDFMFCWLWGHCTKGRTLPSGDTTMTPLKCKLRI